MLDCGVCLDCGALAIACFRRIRCLLKFVIFQKDRLQAVLDEAPFCVMGAKLNYEYPLRADSFIDEVKERWETMA